MRSRTGASPPPFTRPNCCIRGERDDRRNAAAADAEDRPLPRRVVLKNLPIPRRQPPLLGQAPALGIPQPRYSGTLGELPDPLRRYRDFLNRRIIVLPSLLDFLFSFLPICTCATVRRRPSDRPRPCLSPSNSASYLWPSTGATGIPFRGIPIPPRRQSRQSGVRSLSTYACPPSSPPLSLPSITGSAPECALRATSPTLSVPCDRCLPVRPRP